MEKATFAGGCFWCTEAIFRRLRGATKVVSGYTGGKTTSPTYEDVSSGLTGHAESIEITFDSKLISYHDLVEIFMETHDPTTRNQQGADVGTQYRSVIFFHDLRQQKIAKETVNKYRGAVTEILPANTFYPAETEHQQYYERNTATRYCSIVISPKIQKLMTKFADKVEPGYLE